MLINRSEYIFHILTKESLICKDIFLFNLAKSFQILDFPFENLEAIKDGYAVLPKHNPSILDFNTPNTVMVFSNKLPYNTAILSDRWLIFRIVDDNLVNLVTRHYIRKSSFPKISKNESSDKSDEELNEKI